MARVHLVPLTSFDEILGLWTRVLLEEPIGTEADTTTQVFWLQTRTLFADIRIPVPNKISGSAAAAAGRLYEQIARQKGFAGVTAITPADTDNGTPGQITWNRTIDYQPPTGMADVGYASFTTQTKDTLIEYGLEGDDYKEIWKRVDCSAEGLANQHMLAMTLESEAIASKSNDETFVNQPSVQGILVGAGDRFISCVDSPRQAALSQNNAPLTFSTAAAFLEAARNTTTATLGDSTTLGNLESSRAALFGVDIALFSSRRLLLSTRADSTLPTEELFLEMVGTFKLVDDSTVVQSLTTQAGERIRRIWRVQENSYPQFPLSTLSP
ncbi:hypothetical protein CAOG_08618 [Capsaspora owczarzaki ATCC 30864]|uniref:Uncharacterized protein n=1 Tax=Capsaspora owczarzaki (strain ATCC 30864) TaxID=595528 RepID=A0A0D2U8L1_CAPO3|nr:hypothetical protein CAOG_08618 [Capsaspora owczarzaki ATCC 30864]KJE91421.1 hypothetical protein CAOG_008618 [Capsaspora owczarzaki ATCC 30864]|eukprot:XP_011270218.1 hypothetical protein CAOG_08618 [Capsaspora owczarzaki ATCC 30864]